MLEFIRSFHPRHQTLQLYAEISSERKTTSSAIGYWRNTQRLFRITDINNPARFNLRRGVLARSANGGIHFADELFKNKRPDSRILGRNRRTHYTKRRLHSQWIHLSSRQPTMKNSIGSKMKKAKDPLLDAKLVMFLITNYKQQMQVTAYAIGDRERKTIAGNKLQHGSQSDLRDFRSVALSALPHTEN